MTVGEKVIGNFNAQNLDGVDKIKRLATELIDEIEKIETSGRLTQAMKTTAQMDILKGQTIACGLFYKKDV